MKATVKKRGKTAVVRISASVMDAIEPLRPKKYAVEDLLKGVTA